MHLFRNENSTGNGAFCHLKAKFCTVNKCSNLFHWQPCWFYTEPKRFFHQIVFYKDSLWSQLDGERSIVLQTLWLTFFLGHIAPLWQPDGGMTEGMEWLTLKLALKTWWCFGFYETVPSRINLRKTRYFWFLYMFSLKNHRDWFFVLN